MAHSQFMQPFLHARAGIGLSLLVCVGGCKDLTGSPKLPSGTQDPSVFHTKAGAIGMRNQTIYAFQQAMPSFITDAGLLTDELEDRRTGASVGAVLSNGGQVSDPLDERILPTGAESGSGTDYGNLQGIRTLANQAIGAVATYDTASADRTSSRTLRGELYALEGYAEIMLADLFCSGVPLSTLNFQSDFTYAPSSTEREVYQAAIAKFDTALTLAEASDPIMRLAQVGQGRAYLDLGEYGAASDDVAAVPDGFQYQLALNWAATQNCGFPTLLNCTATVSDREGHNGLPFLSSGDPRTVVDVEVPSNPSQGVYVPLTFPEKYSTGLGGSGFAAFTLASGVEARLIQAEAAWHGVATGRSWIGQLNVLRRAQGMDTIADPGAANPAAQIDTLFTERAYWLFLTGERQGDLRRLLRQYGQYYPGGQSRVYPAGEYLALGSGIYGTDVNAPIPSAELNNPKFHGCLDRGA